MTGCVGSVDKKQGPKAPYVFYLNGSNTALISDSLNAKDMDNPGIGECIDDLTFAPLGEGYIAPLADIPLDRYELDEGTLTLYFGREYESLTGIKEVLTRAAIVRTLVQCKDVKEVLFMVSGNPLAFAQDAQVGPMTAETFVDYFGKEQDSLLSENFTIYYANDDGSGLIREVHRTYFENTLSLEQAVIRSMKETPETSGARIAISPNANVINITTTDGVCYLDMDMSFYDSNTNISPNMALQAIVNSLCELNGIRHVEINIIANNEENLIDIPAVSLSGTYEKDTEKVIN